MTTDKILKVDDLSVEYDDVLALEDVSLSVESGEIVGVIGPNGAGKSTLADTIAGFKKFVDGRISYKDRSVSSMKKHELIDQNLIYCTEHRDLFGFMTVNKNLRLGSYRCKELVEAKLAEVYNLFPRLEKRSDQKVRTLSGGEQQMVALGRAVMGNPDFLLLDEPTIGLAPVIVDDICEALRTMQNQSDITILICEQNFTFTKRLADRIYLLENGEINWEGTTDDIESDNYVTEAYIG